MAELQVGVDGVLVIQTRTSFERAEIQLIDNGDVINMWPVPGKGVIGKRRVGLFPLLNGQKPGRKKIRLCGYLPGNTTQLFSNDIDFMYDPVGVSVAKNLPADLQISVEAWGAFGDE